MKIIKCLLLSTVMLMLCTGCNSTGSSFNWANFFEGISNSAAQYNAQQQRMNMLMMQQTNRIMNNLNNGVHYCSRYWCE